MATQEVVVIHDAHAATKPLGFDRLNAAQVRTVTWLAQGRPIDQLDVSDLQSLVTVVQNANPMVAGGTDQMVVALEHRIAAVIQANSNSARLRGGLGADERETIVYHDTHDHPDDSVDVF